MHTKLGKPMPVSEIKEDIEDICIMRFREKAIKDRYRTLNEKIKTKCPSHVCHLLATYPRSHELSFSSTQNSSLLLSLYHQSQMAGFLET